MQPYGFLKDESRQSSGLFFSSSAPLYVRPTRNELKNLIQSKPELSQLSKRFWRNSTRAKTPLYVLEKPEKFNTNEQALLDVYLFTYLSTPVNLKTHPTKFKADKLKSVKIYSQLPEVYFEDDVFQSLTKKSNDAFYSSLSY